MTDLTDVERRAPGAAPTAFRIWRYGENMTDHAPVVFSQRSADLLLEQQAKRGNLFPIDLDHLSILPDTPLAMRAAVGWHRLAVRPDADGNPELWAVDVEWTTMARQGLESSPPAWRYFSPVWHSDPETHEVIAYVNTALTNLPATHFVTALAASQLTGALRIPRASRARKEAPMSEAHLRKKIEKLQREIADLKAARLPTAEMAHVANAASSPPRSGCLTVEEQRRLDEVFGMYGPRTASVRREGSSMIFGSRPRTSARKSTRNAEHLASARSPNPHITRTPTALVFTVVKP